MAQFWTFGGLDSTNGVQQGFTSGLTCSAFFSTGHWSVRMGVRSLAGLRGSMNLAFPSGVQMCDLLLFSLPAQSPGIGVRVFPGLRGSSKIVLLKGVWGLLLPILVWFAGIGVLLLPGLRGSSKPVFLKCGFSASAETVGIGVRLFPGLRGSKNAVFLTGVCESLSWTDIFVSHFP